MVHVSFTNILIIFRTFRLYLLYLTIVFKCPNYFLIILLFWVLSNISNTSDSVSSGYPNTEKRVENTTRSGVFLTKFEVFG